MPGSAPRIRPGSTYLVGREQLSADVIKSTLRTNAVMLFGGRQSGKTTVLLNIRRLLTEVTGRVDTMCVLQVPVYVDLTALKYDATPEDFFKLLVAKATSSCEQQILGFVGDDKVNDNQSRNLLDWFVSEIRHISARCGEVEPRFLFLLDESKRVLGDRFPRGFQDNLFSLLFGESAGTEYNVTMVFAGAQHLYAFSHDDTSPIGSRAAAHYLKCLDKLAVRELAGKFLPSGTFGKTEQLAERIWERTGGHAGLVARMLEELYGADLEDDISTIVDQAEAEVVRSHRGLLENWTLSLTPEAHAVAKLLSRVDKMPNSAIAVALQEVPMGRFLVPRVVEEFQFMGLGEDVRDGLIRRNEIFWSFYAGLDIGHVADSSVNQVWILIEKTELAMREIICKKYDSAFGLKAEAMMIDVLGPIAWKDIQETKARSGTKYKYSHSPSGRDNMSCMYFGHLVALIINSKAWPSFKHLFRDKRELEDKVHAIMPVRNDRAHFSSVPPKELDRCRIACDDLLVIIDRELQSSP